MNKRGFAFVETIVTLTVLMVALTVLYTVFANLLSQEKRLAEYDNPADKYALFYIKQKWLADGKEVQYKVNKPEETGYKGLYNIEKLIVFKCNESNHNVSNMNKYLAGSDSKLEQYLKTINTCPAKAKYVFVGEFKNTSVIDSSLDKSNPKYKEYNTYSFAHVYYPNVSNQTETSLDEDL